MTKYRYRNILVSVALAAAGAILIGLYVTSYRHSVENGAKTVQVLVATRDIPAGTAGTAVASGGYLETQDVLRRNVVPGAVTAGSQLSSLVAGATIYQGEQVTVRQFKPAAQGGIFAGFSGTQRAMIVPGDPNQLLAGIVSDGDRIDVLTNAKFKSAGQSRVITRTVLQDVPVLRAPGAPATGSAGGSATSSSAITLALTVEQAQKMFFAMKNADWWLVLRPTSHPQTPPASVSTRATYLATGLGSSALERLLGNTPSEAAVDEP